MTITGFPLVGCPDATVLIVGSMPGEESLRQSQYYAHRRNAFWPIMEALFALGEHLSYPERLGLLFDHGIALWDVVRSCSRAGSSDSAIKEAVPNDFSSFWRTNRDVLQVACNGATAHALAMKWMCVPPVESYGHVVRVVALPSTSCANTTPFAVKLAAWRKVLLPSGS